MTRKALGRGLSALMGEASAPPSTAMAQIPVDLIDPNPFQPRRAFSEEHLKELADSIRASGVVQPVLLRQVGGRYQLVAGERRWRAASLAGIQAIPSLVRELSDGEALEIALTENVLREDLSSLEVARAYQAMQERFGYSHEQIAARLGLNRSTITNTLRLLKLPPEIQKLIEQEQLSQGHARALLSCQNPEAQLKLAAAITRDGLSVRQAERMASSAGSGTKQESADDSPEPRADPNLRAAILELERALGTRVKIAGNDQRGRIEISYYSAQDLNRLYEWLMRK